MIEWFNIWKELSLKNKNFFNSFYDLKVAINFNNFIIFNINKFIQITDFIISFIVGMNKMANFQLNVVSSLANIMNLNQWK